MTDTDAQRPRSLVDDVLDSANGPGANLFPGLGALVAVVLLGPVGAAAWLASVRQASGRFLRREISLSAVWVPLASVLTFGVVGAIWRVVVLAPLVEEVQTRAGLPRPSVHRGRYALPFFHAVFVQEDLAAAWLAVRAHEASDARPAANDA